MIIEKEKEREREMERHWNYF